MPRRKREYINKLEYNNTYNRNNYRSFSVRLNNQKEADVIEWLESQESLKQYLLSLIKQDMEMPSKKKDPKKSTKASQSKASKKK